MYVLVNMRIQEVLINAYFFSYCHRDHRDLHSFPTRRSSDLGVRNDLDEPAAVVQAAEVGQRVREAEVGEHPRRSSREQDVPDEPDHVREQDRVPEADERVIRSEEHTSELQSLTNLVCRLLLE